MTTERDLMHDKTTHREAAAAKAQTNEWHCDHYIPHPETIVPWTPYDAEKAFLERYALCAERRLGKRW